MKTIGVFDNSGNYRELSDYKSFFENYLFQNVSWDLSSNRVKARFESEVFCKLSKLENLFFLKDEYCGIFLERYGIKKACHSKISMTAYNMVDYLIFCAENNQEIIYAVSTVGTSRAPIRYRVYEITNDISCRKIILDKLLYTTQQ